MRPLANDTSVGIVRLPHAEGLPLPAYETPGSAGMDVRAAVPEDRPLLILPGKRALVPTGLILEIPEGFEAQVRPRSGLAFKHGITCLNTPGTIDSDYRGEAKVLLVNLGDEDFSVTRGMRIAQIVFSAVSSNDGRGAQPCRRDPSRQRRFRFDGNSLIAIFAIQGAPFRLDRRANWLEDFPGFFWDLHRLKRPARIHEATIC